MGVHPHGRKGVTAVPGHELDDPTPAEPLWAFPARSRSVTCRLSARAGDCSLRLACSPAPRFRVSSERATLTIFRDIPFMFEGFHAPGHRSEPGPYLSAFAFRCTSLSQKSHLGRQIAPRDFLTLALVISLQLRRGAGPLQLSQVRRMWARKCNPDLHRTAIRLFVSTRIV
jgi:hypothetical protein